MTYLMALLPTILCPLVMGLMLWLMMRRQPADQTSKQQLKIRDQTTTPPVQASGATAVMNQTQSSFRMPRLCLNWKVLGGLASLGLGIWIVAPQAALFILPFLLIAACPLSMLLMMRGMQGSQCASSAVKTPATPTTTLREEEQLAHLRTEQMMIAQKTAHLGAERDGAAGSDHVAASTTPAVEAIKVRV